MHGSPLLPVVVQSLPSWVCGQLRLPHALLTSHCTSQPHALSHVTLPHALLPMHITEHEPEPFWPHVMLPHALSPVQITLHDAASWQWIDPHALFPVQSTVHAMPEGHSNVLPPVPPISVQLGGDASRLQLVHCDGQSLPITQ